ncbi:MAG: beta-galactosidase [Armatimonadota bacterium]
MEFPFIYGAQYYRAPTPDSTHWAEDLKRMADNGFNAVKFWAQWRWTHRTPDTFYFDDLDTLMDLAAQNGLKVTINVLFDVAPNWIFDTYPDCTMVTSAGHSVEPRTGNCRQIGGYPGPCFNHAESLDARKEFLRKVVERYASHPAMGMWDVWNEPESCYLFRDPKEDMLVCYCPRCHAGFIDWLKECYGTIEHLNSVWGRCYSDWKELELPRGQSVLTDMVDWRIYNIDVLAGEARWRLKTAKSIDPVHPVYLHPVPNTLTIFNPITGVDDFKMVEDCDCFAGTTNGIPSATVQTVSSGQGRVCYNVESHLRYGCTSMYPKQLVMKDFADCFVPQIGLGIRGFLHWQYRCEVLGGESPAWGLLDINGKPGVSHKGASEFWQRVMPFAEKLMTAPVETPEVAVFKSTANEIFHWCMYGSMMPLAEDIEGFTQLLYRSNARFSYVNDDIVVNGLPDSVKVLIVPNCYAMYQPVADALIKWVQDGGTLICEAHTGGYNLTTGRHSLDMPGLGMSDAFGLREVNATAAVHLGITGTADLGDGLSSDLQKAISAFGFAGGEVLPIITKDNEMLWGWSRYTELEGDGIEPIASLPGRSTCTASKRVGKGTIYYIGSLAGKMWMHPGSPGLDTLVESAMKSAGLPANSDRFPWAPKNLRVDLLQTTDGTAIALSNRGGQEVEFDVRCDEPMTGIYTGQKTGTALKLGAGQAELLVPSRWREGV